MRSEGAWVASAAIARGEGIQDSPQELLAAGRMMARAFAESVVEEERLATARAFGSRLLAAWWRHVAKSSGSRSLRPPLEDFEVTALPPAAEALADSLGDTAAQLGAEIGAYHIGMIYTSMLPRAHRAALGIYYTPPALTERLLAQASEAGVDWTRCRVLDPACGGGAFLAPVARQILEALPGCAPRILIENISNRLRGYELDPFAAWLSQVALDAVMLPIAEAAGRRLPVLVTVCDSLRREPDPDDRFDLVIGNPPYGRVRLDAPDRSRFKRSLFGHANLYGLFTDLALTYARDGGVIAFVTPTSFLAGEYFKNLRALLGRKAQPVSLDFVSVRRGVFEDVLQETLLATYKVGCRGRVAVHEITPVKDGPLRIEDAGRHQLPSDPSQPWILPRCATQAPLVAVLATRRCRLVDWGYGVSTGPLVWNRFKQQLAHRPGRNRYPLIWSEAVSSDGRFAWRAEKRGHTAWFEVRAGDDWLMVTEPCVLLQRTTAKEQSRRLIAAALPAEFLDAHGAVIVENHLNMVRPLHPEPAVAAPVLGAFINSDAADRAFRCLSGSVAVSAYELEALPLPAPEDLSQLARLVAGRAGRECIEAECARLYESAL